MAGKNVENGKEGKNCTCSFVRFLRKEQRKSQDLDFHKAVEKMGKEKRLKSNEFLSVYASIWQVGPAIKYESPHKWERVNREGIPRNSVSI